MIATCLPSHDGDFNSVEEKFGEEAFNGGIAEEGCSNNPQGVVGANWREVNGKASLFGEFIVTGEAGEVPE